MCLFYVWANEGADTLSSLPTSTQAMISNFGFSYTLNTHTPFCVPERGTSNGICYRADKIDDLYRDHRNVTG